MKKIIVPIATTAIILTGLSQVDAKTWTANSPEQIKSQIETGNPEYHIHWGDTLYHLANATNTDVNTLAQMNKDRISHPDLIITDDYLRIPVQQWDNQLNREGYVAPIKEGQTVKESERSDGKVSEVAKVRKTQAAQSNDRHIEDAEKIIREYEGDKEGIQELVTILRDEYGFTDDEIAEVLSSEDGQPVSIDKTKPNPENASQSEKTTEDSNNNDEDAKKTLKTVKRVYEVK